MSDTVYEFKFPDVGEGLTEGKLIEWKVGIGDNIKTDQPLCSVETDKAVVDIPSPVTGKVIELLNKVDDTLIVGNVIITIDIGNDEKTIPDTNEEHEKQKIEQKNPNEKEISNGEKSYKMEGLQEMGNSKKEETKEDENKSLVQEEITENKEVPKEQSAPAQVETKDSENNTNNIKAMLSVRKYAKENNIDLNNIKATGNHGQILMGDLGNVPKQTQDTKSEETETIKEEVKENVEVPQEESMVEENKEEEEPPQKTEVPKETSNVDESDYKNDLEHYQDAVRNIVSSPSVREAALKKGIDISKIKGSGENGRIELKDLETSSSNEPEKEENISEESNKVEDIEEVKEQPVQETEVKVEEEIKEDSKTEKDDVTSKTSEKTNIDDHHLNQTKESLTLPRDIPMPYDSIRQIIAEKMVDSLQKTAQLTIFNKICIDNLVEFRKKEKEILKEHGVKLTYLPFFIKAFIAAAKEFPTFNAISTENSTIIKSDFNIGIAMDTPRGLLVPNVFNAQTKSIVQIAKDIMTLVDKGNNSKITSEDMSNGTFTITSLGAKGGQFFTPILNYPQTAILGIGEISKQPVVKNDEIVIGNVLHLSLTFDHRAVDGAEASKFFNKICELLKDVDSLLMEA